MSELHKNLGRGLGDLIGEVSTVKAIPAQPAGQAATPDAGGTAPAAAPAANPSSPAAETPAPARTPVSILAAALQKNAANTTPAPVSAPQSPEKSAAMPAASAPLPPAKPVMPAAAPVKKASIIEERPSDAEINSQRNIKHEPPREVVKELFVPVWAKVAIVGLAVVAAVLGYVLMQTSGDLKKSQAAGKNAQDQITSTQAALDKALNADPLPWLSGLHVSGVHIQRTIHRNAEVIFDEPFFSGDLRSSPAGNDALRDLVTQLKPHANDIILTIVGHAAPFALPRHSPYRDNLDLGLKRANAVLNAMLRANWPEDGVSARTAGDREPVVPGDDALSELKNRTISIEIRPR